MTATGVIRPTWVIDTSAIVAIKRLEPVSRRAPVMGSLTKLVDDGRVVMPDEVFAELQRGTDHSRPDLPFVWARQNRAKACSRKADYERVKAILSTVPQLLDPHKDSGEDEADPYVLALAIALRAEGLDARVVTQEKTDSPTRTSLSTAAGIFGVPSVPLQGLITAEGI